MLRIIYWCISDFIKLKLVFECNSYYKITYFELIKTQIHMLRLCIGSHLSMLTNAILFKSNFLPNEMCTNAVDFGRPPLPLNPTAPSVHPDPIQWRMNQTSEHKVQSFKWQKRHSFRSKSFWVIIVLIL